MKEVIIDSIRTLTDSNPQSGMSILKFGEDDATSDEVLICNLIYEDLGHLSACTTQL